MSQVLAVAVSPTVAGMLEYLQPQSADFQRAVRIANEYASQPPREPHSPKLHDNDTLQRADRIRSKWNKR